MTLTMNFDMDYFYMARFIDKLHMHRNRINDDLQEKANKSHLRSLIYENLDEERPIGNFIWSETETWLREAAYDL